MNILQKFKNLLRADKRIILFSLAMGFVITLGVAVSTKIYSDRIQQSIAEKVIRFHVLANSNLEADQELKLKIRDAVLAEYEGILNTSENIAETRSIILENMNGIQAVAEETIKLAGRNYSVAVSLGRSVFPTVEYENIRLPAGEYETLKIVVGEGVGDNWWCVMFPPLCFVDITRGVISDEALAELEETLTAEEFKLLTSSEDVAVEVRFRIVEWWQNRRHASNNSVVLR
ncbi:MAG: stage II sporulation protein R [Defluviitaleaceae bacterium]|nr:stage II sporulation protein R [Defluviitaleaceae bacterium]